MTAKKENQTTNASLKKYAEPRNKTGKGGFADRPETINRNGQRNKEVVQTAAEYRSLLVKILHEPHGTPLPAEMSNLEVIARVHVANSKKESDEREKLLDRIWGKANQPIDLTSSDGSMTPKAITFIPHHDSTQPDGSDDSTTT